MSKDKMNWIQDVVNELNVYEFEETLPGSKRPVKFKPITPLQLKKILQYEDVKDQVVMEDIIDKIILDSVTSENFNIDNLFVQDRIFLFFCIRIRSKGSVLDIKTACKECKSQYVAHIDFANIECKERSDDIEYKIELGPKSYIELQHITRGDMKEILKLEKTMKSKNDREKALNIAFLAYAASIKTITFNGTTNEDLSLNDKLYFLENIAESIFDKITTWVNDNDFGLELNFDNICPHCGYNDKMKVTSSDLM